MNWWLWKPRECLQQPRSVRASVGEPPKGSRDLHQSFRPGPPRCGPVLPQHRGRLRQPRQVRGGAGVLSEKPRHYCPAGRRPPGRGGVVQQHRQYLR